VAEVIKYHDQETGVYRINGRKVVQFHASIEDRRQSLVRDIDGYDGAPGVLWAGSLNAEHPF
jgi:hypothetical protein